MDLIFDPPELGCVLHLPGLPGGGSTILDRSPYGHTCTISGATWTFQNGLWHLVFNGNDYVDITAVLRELATTTKGTIVLWVKPDDATPNPWESPLTFADTSAAEFLSFQITTTGFFRVTCWEAGANPWYLDTDVSPFSNGVWTQIGVTHDEIAPVLYVNGIAPAQTFGAGWTDKTKWFFDLAGLDNGFLGCKQWNGGVKDSFLNGITSRLGLYSYKNALGMQNCFKQEKHLFGVV